MTNKPQFYLVCGRSGVGKTEFAQKLSKLVNAVHINVDDCYKVIKGDYSSREDKFWVWMTLFQVLHAYEGSKIDCILDSACLKKADRDQFLGWFPDFDHHLIFIDATDEVIAKQNRQRERIVPEEKLKKQKETRQPPDMFTVDKGWVSGIFINKRENDTRVFMQGEVAVTYEQIKNILSE